MYGKSTLFDFHWNVDKYISNYDPEYWELCRSFMVTHKTKYPEQKLVHLTEAFYQIGVYGSSYDPKTTRMVSALAIEVLDKFLESHPGSLRHPFNKSAVVEVTEIVNDQSKEKDADGPSTNQSQSSSIWDVTVDKKIIVNMLNNAELKVLLKGFIIIYDVRKTSTMNDNKVNILEESFKRSKFGQFHWDKVVQGNNICPIKLFLKWKGAVLAEAEGSDEKALRVRLAQAVLSKIANFSYGIEAKWSYFRDGKMPDIFERPNPRKNNIYKIMPRSQFKAMAEITSFIDTFANSESFAEIIFGMDFSSQEKKQIMEHITKTWGTRLTYRTLHKMGAKNKSETHVCMYHIKTGEEMKRWLDQCGGDNERYRLIPPGEHRRAGTCDNNVRDVLKSDAVDLTEDVEDKTPSAAEVKEDKKENKENTDKKERTNEKVKPQTSKDKDEKSKSSESTNNKSGATNKEDKKDDDKGEAEDLEKLLNGFVLFYDAKKNSEIDKDDWFSALCDSFKLSNFGQLEVLIEDVRPLRTRCTLKCKGVTLASAEGLTETQAKTAATLQVISKLEPFTYIIQAKEDYFFGGKVPAFIEFPNPNKSDVYRVVRRKDLPSYYSIFQTIDEFILKPSHAELVFGTDFTWELKNEIIVYLKVKGLDYRYFTTNDQKPWTHMAVYHRYKPEDLKDHLLKVGGENEKYKLIPPQKAEQPTVKTTEPEPQKEKEKPVKPPLAKVAEKRKLPEKEPPPVTEAEINKIQIKLKTFKKDKVEYPEDTTGDFPGLIIFVGIKKNSSWQRSLFCILLDSFKMSKYGELVVEESEENVWGRKEPFKKCVVKANRKVLAVGLGESKTEAKSSASLQVLRQLRKHCYTIQAKESYFKEGKTTPYDFNPDPKKSNVYRVVKRSKFKDRQDIIKFVDDFSRKRLPEELIFGEDFTYDEREHILQHCRQINLCYRLIKCQSTGKFMHTHIAIFYQRPLPLIKAALIKAGGENDMFRLIPPGGNITYQNHQNEPVDLWPDTLEGYVPAKSSAPPAATTVVNQNLNNGQLTSNSPGVHSVTASKPVINTNYSATKKPSPLKNSLLPVLSLNFNQTGNAIDNFAPDMHLVNPNQPGSKKIPVKVEGINARKTSAELVAREKKDNSLQDQPLYDGSMGPQPMLYNDPIGSQPYMQPYSQPMPGPPIQEVPFGPQPFHVNPMPMGANPYQDTPLSFGPQPQPLMHGPMHPGNVPGHLLHASGSNIGVIPPKGAMEIDLRDELAKKRQSEIQTREVSERKVYDTSTERKVIRKDGASEEDWSRKVFVDETEGKAAGESRENSQDLRQKLSHRDSSKELARDRLHRRGSVERDRRRSPPDRDRQRKSPERGRRRSLSRERRSIRSREDRIVRERDLSYERKSSRDRIRDRSRNRYGHLRDSSRSPIRSPLPNRYNGRVTRSPSPVMRLRPLWDNISTRFSESIFMYKYVKQDSTTERHPFSLLRATMSLDFSVDFEFIEHQIARNEWQVSVELLTSDSPLHPLVGEGIAETEEEARLLAALHAVDTIQKACRVIEPNYRYFAEGETPDFILRKHPMKTSVYEIIQNMDPTKPLDRYTTEVMFRMFISSGLEDLFFLATDFSYLERVNVVEISNQMNLSWRLFGPRHPDARPDDVVSTQHVCVFKEKSALKLVQELIANGGSTEKYTLVDPRENRITSYSNWPRRGIPH